MSLPKLIDNKRRKLSDVINNIAPNFKHLSIATGYWDLPGTIEILNSIKNYESIRLIIGQEPISRYKQKKLNLYNIDDLFPDSDINNDLIEEAQSNNHDIKSLLICARTLCGLISDNKLIVKVYRKKFLHAKAYIFGNYDSSDAVGIVGSSNFTEAGLRHNAELNSLVDENRIIQFKPLNDSQEHGYMSWFEELWNDPDAEVWSGDFKELIENSPLGDLCFGPYDVYIKTLMELYPEEINPPETLEKDINDVLFNFQSRNAGILIRKLEKMNVAILADSVGLGKTITAGAVISYYQKKLNNKANVLVITPAALKQQWIDDLGYVLGLDSEAGAFKIISQQDTNKIEELYDYYNKPYRTARDIDLFIIDEAHNLRSKTGTRHDVILNLLQQHPNSHILLLTATPINNSLMDIANQIQLASKGKRLTVNVSYIRPDDGQREMLDFLEALKRIQTRIKKTEREGGDLGKLLEEVKPTIHEGLRHYLVRSTRQGVEAEGGLVKGDGGAISFPKSNVDSISYKFDNQTIKFVSKSIYDNRISCFEGIDTRELNLDLLSEFTQISLHPLDIMNSLLDNDDKICEMFNISREVINKNGTLRLKKPIENVVPNILQCIYMIGFTPYRPDIYNYKFYGKTIKELNEYEEVSNSVRMQLTVHNIMQITWLKRLESSAAALLYSVNNYRKRIDLFSKYLDKGYIVTLGDANLLENDYNDGEDIEQAFIDYDEYLREKEKLIEEGKDPSELKKHGIEKKEANPKIYNIKQIKADIERDKKIINFLNGILLYLEDPTRDPKIIELVSKVKNVISSNTYGKKVVVFSFFADTVNYLKENLHKIIENEIPDFSEKSEFISGQSNNINNIVSKFSPISKKYSFKSGEKELDFLFSTDVLSEGQNLQDAGFLINYDLHWNPVRMIQRNGRINRLGSTYEDVLISNMRPTDELELYLNLVHRLETKIGTIKNTVGLDQGVLTNEDVNPIEFIEKYYTTGELKEPEDLLAHSDEHIIALRKFLSLHRNDDVFSKIYNMPLGKWNYLPVNKYKTNCCISLIRTFSETVESNKKVSDLFFISLKDYANEYVVEYMDYTKALDIIKTDADDNARERDNIYFDRAKVLSRSKGEARRQATNPSYPYNIKPQYQKALLILSDHFDKSIDIKGIISRGVTLINHQQKLEKILRNVNKETRDHGSPSSVTISEFISLFNEIQLNVAEEKKFISAEGVLFYAGK